VKILKSRVNWMHYFDSDPIFEVLVDKLPALSDMIFTEKNNTYYAEKDGFVSFYYYKGPGRGFGGHTFNIKLQEDNQIVQKCLKGPWSSRAGHINKIGFKSALGFSCGDCIDLTNDVKVFQNRYTFHGGVALTEDLLVKCAELAGCFLIKASYDEDFTQTYHPLEEEINNKEFTYCPSLDKNTLAKPYSGNKWKKL